MPKHYPTFGDAAGAAMAHNARMAAEHAEQRAQAAVRARIAPSPRPGVPQLADVDAEQRPAAAEDDTPTGQKYPTLLRIYCDACDTGWGGDFIVTDTMTKTQRLDVVRNHARTELGWQCDTAGDFCPECKQVDPLYAAALLAGADAIEALPQDFECDPGRGDAVKLLRRMAGAKAQAEPVEEQPAPLTMADRADHAVNLYARTAVDLEDARAELAKLRAERDEDERDVYRYTARIDAARALHTQFADSPHCAHDGEQWPCPTVLALDDDQAEEQQAATGLPTFICATERQAAPGDVEAYPGELAMLRGVLGVVRSIADHGDITELRRIVAEHRADEQAAHDDQAGR